MTPCIEGFSIERTLGHGGMGTVFLARDLVLDRLVALKLLPRRLAADKEAQWRFHREARTLARVMHPGVVPIHALGAQGDLHYIVMGHVEGEPLSAVLKAARENREGRFARYFSREHGHGHIVDLACASVARAVADALEDLHRAGIVHRDVKPANVVINAKGCPILVDFGIACDPTSERLACDAISTGTLRFMPPEHVSGGAAHVDSRSDVYSLGVMLFEMLTLTAAFPQTDADMLVEAISAGTGQSPRSLERSVPRSLDDIVRRATMPAPGERFQSAREMADALGSAVRQLLGTADFADSRVLGLELEAMAAAKSSKSTLSRIASWLGVAQTYDRER